ncbi:hypothetical protein C8R45DRAFT_1109839 [Mycena sanguinolenta]|nr:hypothetical protein C8R45DRAFT_1109839 [Mycena sanguinolenta]
MHARPCRRRAPRPRQHASTESTLDSATAYTGIAPPPYALANALRDSRMVLLPAFDNLVRCSIVLGRLHPHYRLAGTSTPKSRHLDDPLSVRSRARSLCLLAAAYHAYRDLYPTSLARASTSFRAPPLDSVSSHTLCTAATPPRRLVLLSAIQGRALLLASSESVMGRAVHQIRIPSGSIAPTEWCTFRYCDDDAARFDHDGYHLHTLAHSPWMAHIEPSMSAREMASRSGGCCQRDDG